MKEIPFVVLVLALLCVLNSPFSTARAQGTAFSYQGRLNTPSGPANGIYDLTFTLFNTNAGGTLISGPVTNSSVGVSNGLFTVAVDFGSAPFTLGQRLWLEIGARTNGAAAFSTLAPRQAVLSTPIATYAQSVDAASLIGQVTDANLSTTFTSPHTFNNAANSFTGNGSGLTALNGSQITSGTVADARLSLNVPLLNAGNTYTGLNVYNNLIKVVGPVSNNGYFGFLEEDTSFTGDFWILTKWDNVGNKRFSIYDGNGVTPIVFQEHGGNVGIGTNQPGALLEVNGNAQIDGPVTATSFSGNGNGLTALNGSQITSGTVADARLSSNVALRAGGNTFTGNQVINAGGAGVKVAGTAAPSTYFGSLISDGGPGDFWFLSAYNASGSKRNTIYGAGGATPLVFQEQGGNVGIGITTPTNTLQVNGTVAASALRAPGAGINTGTFAFIQRAVGTNTTGDQTFIYNPVCDGDPNAILIVTHNWTADTNSTSQYNTKPVGVYYTGANWAIFNEDTSAMALGRAFNVMVIKN